MKTIHIQLPDQIFILWKEYASHYKNYADAIKNIPYIKEKIAGQLIIDNIPKKRGPKKI